jgi:TolB-like protein
MPRSAPLVFVLSLAVLAYSTSAHAAADAADGLAAELAAGMAKALGKPAANVLVEPVTGADPAVSSFHAAFLKALVTVRGVSVIDRAALEASIKEAALSSAVSDSVLAEMAGAAGAQIVVRLQAEKSGLGWVVHARAINVATGVVLAAGRAEVGAISAGAPIEADTLEAQLRRLADKLARALDAMEGDLRYQQVAVLRFEESGARAKENQLGLLVSSELTTALRRDHGILLVERANLNKIIDEQALGQTGLIDEKNAAEVGKLAGAQFMVLGNIAEAGDRYLVNAKIVSTVDGLLHGAEEVSLPAADLIALSSDAVVLRSTSGSVYRSILLPGWGQFYNRQTIKGTVFIGAEVLAGGLALTFQLLGQSYLKKYDGMETPRNTQVEMDDMWDKQKSAFGNRNLLLIALGVVHAANIIDAFISGKSFESATPGAGSTFSLQF